MFELLEPFCRAGWMLFQTLQLSYFVIIALKKDTVFNKYYGQWTATTSILLVQLFVITSQAIDELYNHTILNLYLTLLGTIVVIMYTNMEIL